MWPKILATWWVLNPRTPLDLKTTINMTSWERSQKDSAETLNTWNGSVDLRTGWETMPKSPRLPLRLHRHHLLCSRDEGWASSPLDHEILEVTCIISLSMFFTSYSRMSFLTWLWLYLYYPYGGTFVIEMICEMQICNCYWCTDRCICYFVHVCLIWFDQTYMQEPESGMCVLVGVI
jgi:hypothetical protein